MPKILIDGYNLIRQVPELAHFENESLEAGRRELLKQLALYRHYKPHTITVVFDGRSEFSESATPFRQNGLWVCFSTQAQSADDVLVSLLGRDNADTVVVSSDRFVQQLCRAKGAVVLDSVEFYKKVRLAVALEGQTPRSSDQGTKPAHKRWSTYKKGPSKRLPKKLRQNKNRTQSL